MRYILIVKTDVNEYEYVFRNEFDRESFRYTTEKLDPEGKYLKFEELEKEDFL